MTTTELQQIIITVLKQGHNVTIGQLHGLVNAELSGMGSPGTLKQPFSRALREMSRTGAIKRTVDGGPARYRMHPNPEPFEDSFTTIDASFAVAVKVAWGETTEDIEVKIDCGGMIHGDEDTIDVLIEMLDKAKDNLAARRLARKRNTP